MLGNQVILVDKQNNAIGEIGKAEAHQKGLLHRSFAVFVFNKNQELLIQKRELKKQYSGGLWSNTCLGHPQINEINIEAAHRRLREEMGFDCTLIKAFDYLHKSELENQTIENEYTEVFFGIYNGKPKINRHEASDWDLINLSVLKKLMKESPGSYSICLHISFKNMLEFTIKHFEKLPIQDYFYNLNNKS